MTPHRPRDPSAPDPTGERVFVGRDAETRMVDARLRAGRAGRGQLVAIVGEAGIGKSRLVEEAIARAEPPAAPVLWGRCPDDEGVPAYWPWSQVLRAYAAHTDDATLARDLAGAAGIVGQIVPSLRARVPEAPAHGAIDPEQSRFLLFDAIAGLLQRVATRTPHVIVLDDLHWADEGTMLLLGFVARAVRESPLVILATYREHEMRRAPDRLRALTDVDERIVLRGLAPSETERLIAGAAPAPLPAATVAELQRVSEGNPFFIGELVRWLDARGAAGSGPGVALPESVREVIRLRLAPLDDDDRRLLTMAAVIGDEFDLLWLQNASELPPGRILERLNAAAGAGLVRELRVGRFRFAHALVRETLYHDLPPARRAGLHQHVGTALERLFADGGDSAPLAELAHHFFHAAAIGDVHKAIDYASRAGARAVQLVAYEEAVRQFGRALDILRLAPDASRELRILLGLGDALWRAGDHAHSRETFTRAADRARALGDAAALAEAALGCSAARVETGIHDETLSRLLEASLVALGDADTALRARVLARLAEAYYFVPPETRRDALSREAVAVARRVGDPIALIVTLNTRNLMLLGVGSVEERVAITAEAAELAAAHGDRQRALECQGWRLVNLLELGDTATFDRELERFTVAADEHRIPFYRWQAMVVRSTGAILSGNFETGARLADAALAMMPSDPTSLARQSWVIQMASIWREEDRLEELEAPLTALAEQIPGVPAWRCALATLYTELGRDGAARALLDQVAANGFRDLPRDTAFLGALAPLARVIAALRDPTHAATVYELIAPYADRNIVIGLGQGCYGPATLYLGMLAAAQGQLPQATEHFEQAIAMSSRMRAWPYLARAQYGLARLLLTFGGASDHARASALLGEVRATATMIGMRRTLRELDELKSTMPDGTATPDAETDAAADTAVPAAIEMPATAVLRRERGKWRVEWAGASFEVRDGKGIRYLATLLRHPGREFRAIALAADERESGDADGDAAASERPARDDVAALDPAAHAAYKDRLEDLRDTLAEAERFHDIERAERARTAIDTLTRELADAIGIGARGGALDPDAERARLNVTRAIAAAQRRIAAEHPGLGEHLAVTIRTGTLCAYAPDPRRRVRWTT